MSIGKKLEGMTGKLNAALEKKEQEGVNSTGASSMPAPVKLLNYQADLRMHTSRIGELEARIKELESNAILVKDIDPNPWQPRKVFDENEIRLLAESIQEIGLVQPIVVTILSTRYSAMTDVERTELSTRYTLVSGERRLRAHRLLGLETIKAVIIDVSEPDMALMSMAENISRQDLTAYEIFKALSVIRTQFSTVKHLAEAVGIGRNDIYKYLAFEDLPDFILADLDLTPSLMGREAAREVVSSIKNHGEPLIDALKNLWPRISAGTLDQGKLVTTAETTALRAHSTPSNREIKKLFVGTAQAGSITRDSSNLTVKIRAAALTPEMETKLRAFVEQLLKSG
jgi:ParB family chromosome partitioning protein